MVTLRLLATLRLGPELTEEALAHELTIRRRELPTLHLNCLPCPNSNTFFLAGMATMKENKGKGLANKEVT